MARSSQRKNSSAICTWLPMIRVALTKPELTYSEKKEQDHFPPTSDALQPHAMRANYQSKVWLYADKQCIQSSGGWLSMGIGLAAAGSTLPAVPTLCLELVACGCHSKCKSSACKSSKTHQICTPACGCNAEHFCNPTS